MNNDKKTTTTEKKEYQVHTTSTPTIIPSLSPEQEKRLMFLRYKNELANRWKSMSAEQKKKADPELNADFTQEEKEELKQLDKTLDDYKEAKKNELNKINHELVKAPPAYLFEGFDTAKQSKIKEESFENASPLNLEIARLAIAQQLPDKLRPIFEQLFVIRFSDVNWKNPSNKDSEKINEVFKNATGGAFIEPFKDKDTGKQKFRISVDTSTFYENEYENIEGEKICLTYFNTKKFIYIITRAILSTVKDKSNFENICKENGFNKLDKNCKNHDDWLAYVLTEGKNEGNINPKIKEAANQLLNNLKADNITKPNEVTTPIIIKDRVFDEKELNKKLNPYVDSDTKEHIGGFYRLLLENSSLSWLGQGLYTTVETIKNLKSSLINTEYYYMFVAEGDGKEVQKLLSRDLGTGDYIKMIKEPRFLNSKDRLRQLIIAIAKKGAFQWWMAQLWLWKNDKLFKRTKGKEISEDGFDFVTRATKAHAGATKGFFAPGYAKKGNRFVRFSYESQLNKLDTIYNTQSLRSIQNVSPDLYNNIFNNTKKEFLAIDAKLGDTNFSKSGKLDDYASCDINLSSIIGEKETKIFINDMQSYAKNLNEDGFNNLIDAGVVALTRRFVQASKEERQLFSMYTSPFVRQGFEYYKNIIGEPDYATEKYKQDYNESKNKLKEHDFDVVKTAEEYPLEKLTEIYSDFVKEESPMPYVAGIHPTKYGRLKEYIRQTRSQIYEINDLPASIKDFINSNLDRFERNAEITPKELNAFSHLVEEKTASLPLNVTLSLKKTLITLLGHYENLGVAKQYQKLFRPFQEKVQPYIQKTKKETPTLDKEKILNFYFQDLVPNNVPIASKIKDLSNNFEGLTFTEEEINNITSKPDKDSQHATLYATLSRKINFNATPKKIQLSKANDDMNSLYLDLSRFISHPEETTYRDIELSNRFYELELIPDFIKQNKSLKTADMLNAIELAKVVVNDYYRTEDLNRKRRENFMYSDSYDPNIEEEFLFEEE